MRERVSVQNAAAATLLSRPRLQGVVAAMIEQNCTMAELVNRSGMSYSLLSHHLKRMVALGLVRVVGHCARAGRASPIYRAAARSYFLPAALCQALPGEQLALEMRQALQRLHGAKGLLLWSEGGPRMSLVRDPTRADTQELWMRLRLSPAAARQFNEEQRALFERWRAQESATGTRYLVHAACARGLS
jgi:hypothetical protein